MFFDVAQLARLYFWMVAAVVYSFMCACWSAVLASYFLFSKQCMRICCSHVVLVHAQDRIVEEVGIFKAEVPIDDRSGFILKSFGIIFANLLID